MSHITIFRLPQYLIIMPKHIIEFSLPEEEPELRTMLDADKVRSALFDFSEWLRRHYKHENPMSEDVSKEYEKIKAHFFDTMAEHDVDID